MLKLCYAFQHFWQPLHVKDVVLIQTQVDLAQLFCLYFILFNVSFGLPRGILALQSNASKSYWTAVSLSSLNRCPNQINLLDSILQLQLFFYFFI